MNGAIRLKSTITEKGQTTIPKPVRKALGVDEGGSITFLIKEGQVAVERTIEEHEDPALGRFLSLLAADIESRPEHLKPLPDFRSSDLTTREVDVEAPIVGDVDI